MDSKYIRHIIFQGPYSFLKSGSAPSIFSSDISDRRGLYLWTVPVQSKELVYYVGITTKQTFSKRFTQHVQGYLSGEYGLNDPEALQEGKRVRIWDGLWRGVTIETYLEKHDYVFPKLLQLLQLFKLYVAPIEADIRFVERVEAGIATYLYQQKGIVGTFQERGIRYRERRKDETPVTIHLRGIEEIFGLPKTLEI